MHVATPQRDAPIPVWVQFLWAGFFKKTALPGEAPIRQLNDPIGSGTHQERNLIPNPTPMKWRWACFLIVHALIDLRIPTHPSFTNYYSSSYPGEFFTTSTMKDLGKDLSFLRILKKLFSFFDDHCHKKPGKFINILIAINHIMLYIKRSDYQPVVPA